MTEQILNHIRKNPGITAPGLMAAFATDIEGNPWYGRQREVSWAIAQLRREGLIQDDCIRCPQCNRASRSRRNVPLFAHDFRGTE